MSRQKQEGSDKKNPHTEHESIADAQNRISAHPFFNVIDRAWDNFLKSANGDPKVLLHSENANTFEGRNAQKYVNDVERQQALQMSTSIL